MTTPADTRYDRRRAIAQAFSLYAENATDPHPADFSAYLASLDDAMAPTHTPTH